MTYPERGGQPPRRNQGQDPSLGLPEESDSALSFVLHNLQILVDEIKHSRWQGELLQSARARVYGEPPDSEAFISATNILVGNHEHSTTPPRKKDK